MTGSSRACHALALVLTAVVAGALMASAPAAAQPDAENPTIVLVHGAWADTSSWNGEISALRLTHATRHQLEVIHRGLAALDVGADCQVETQMGAIALAELATASDDVLVRTPDGPRLVERTVVLS